jgi:hypothetical protein
MMRNISGPALGKPIERRIFPEGHDGIAKPERPLGVPFPNIGELTALTARRRVKPMRVGTCRRAKAMD